MPSVAPVPPTPASPSGRSGSGRLAGRIALVTGSGRGIGKAIALAFAKEGAAVVVNYLWAEDSARKVGDEVMRLSGKGLVVRADVSKADQVERMVAEAVKRFGTVDVLVNNAGIPGGGPLERLKEELWTKTLDVNLKSAYLTSRAVASHMTRQKFGRILNVASTSALWGLPGQSDYAAAKGGLIAFTKSLALELAPFVQVNCLAPGYVDTEFAGGWPPKEKQVAADRIPLRRFGTGLDVASVAVFLAAESDYITGQTIVIDGGLMLRGR